MTKQKTDNLAAPSDELKELIYFENLFDPGFEFEEVEKAFDYAERNKEIHLTQSPEVRQKNAKEYFNNLLLSIKEKLPLELQELISGKSVHQELDNYLDLAENITQLRASAALATSATQAEDHRNLSLRERERNLPFKQAIEKERSREEPRTWTWKHKMFDPIARNGAMGTTLKLSSGYKNYYSKFRTRIDFGLDYKINFKSIYLMDLLRGIDYRRLRICLVCHKVFWAVRLDKFGCSDKCNQTLRTRRKRQKEKDEAELKEKKRREWLNQDFSKKENEDGTL